MPIQLFFRSLGVAMITNAPIAAASKTHRPMERKLPSNPEIPMPFLDQSGSAMPAQMQPTLMITNAHCKRRNLIFHCQDTHLPLLTAVTCRFKF